MVRNHRVRPARLLATSLLLAVVAGLPAARAVAAPAPQLRLVAAASAVTVERFPGEPPQLDLGANVVAGATPLEIRVTRRSYHDPIVATQRVGKEQARKLPAGMVKDFAGLAGFLHVTLTDTAGRKVLDQDQTFCPNSFQAARTRPDAPDTSPYPQMCGDHPFTLGSVWGLQAGWAAPAAGGGFDPGPEPPPDSELPDGTYTARVSINRPYQQFFAIPSDQASATVKVTIHTMPEEPGPEEPGSEEPPTQEPQTGTNHLAQGGEGEAPSPLAGPGTAPLQPAPRPSGARDVPAGPRPDLRPLPAYGISVGNGEDEEPPVAPVGQAPASPGAQPPAAGEQRQYLSFSANVWNAGPSPLVVDGFRQPGKDLMDAYQYFYDAKGKQVGWAPTGTLEYDTRDGHQHWHFTDFARYRLLREDKKEAVRSGKEAFCLAPTDGIDLTVAGARWKPTDTGLETACGTRNSIAIREALDAGWGDTYTQMRPGQSFDITGVPNGTYYIEVAANPEHRLYETSTGNNVSLRKVVLGGTPAARTVQVPPYEGIDA
ncbi:MAG TPA: lysyl oxidase family protein [Actinomycetes bacterium]|nr:lysyl oxidase family protein [Actinomycetes bacterium]